MYILYKRERELNMKELGAVEIVLIVIGAICFISYFGALVWHIVTEKEELPEDSIFIRHNKKSKNMEADQ